MPGMEESFRLGLTPLITMLSGIIMGPVPGMLTGFLIDLFSVVIWHGLAEFILLFSLIVMVRGFLAGYIYKYHCRRFSLKATFLSITAAYVVTSGLMTPAVLNYYYNVPFIASISQRLTIQALAIPFYTAIVFYILKFRQKSRQLQTMYARIEKQANTDELTGLANRRAFLCLLEKYLAAARRHNHDLYLIYIDLDDFKQVNDILGHRAGDDMLQQVGEILIDVIRSEDGSARLGGDEFALTLFKANYHGARQVAERIRARIGKLTVKGGEDLKLTASLGLAGRRDGDTPEDLLARADRAMYSAKNNRKNSVCSLVESKSSPDTV